MLTLADSGLAEPGSSAALPDANALFYDPGAQLLSVLVSMPPIALAAWWAARRAGDLHLHHGGWCGFASFVVAGWIGSILLSGGGGGRGVAPSQLPDLFCLPRHGGPPFDLREQRCPLDGAVRWGIEREDAVP